MSVRVRFHEPSPELRPYFTTFHLTEFDVPDGEIVHDYLHPEWCNLRIFAGSRPRAVLDGVVTDQVGQALVSGPTSHSTEFFVGRARIWGVGFLPLGWARYMALPAIKYADRIVDPLADSGMAALRPLIASLFGDEPDEMAELARFERFFATHGHARVPDHDRIVATHAALINPDVGTVSEMAEASGIAQHTLERLCRRWFGFPPSLLLRRQRFMRSLAQYMLDPSLKWIGALDSQYHDQAQFVRDFRRFMGMSPTHYAGLPLPVLKAVMRARAAEIGEAVQALHPPEA